MIAACEAADLAPARGEIRRPTGRRRLPRPYLWPLRPLSFGGGAWLYAARSLCCGYRELHHTLGVTRGVLIQPSVYGFDNRCITDALKQLGPSYLGVAVPSPDCADGELDELHEAGVRGVRFNIVFGGGAALMDAELMAGRIGRLGWHLQFLIDVSKVPNLWDLVRRLLVPVVIDHMGHVPAATGLHHKGFLDLVELVKRGECWVKLSGSYRISSEPRPPYRDVVEVAQTLISARTSQCLWATDWPHPHIPMPMPNDGDLLDQLQTWAPDPETIRRILVDNPNASLVSLEEPRASAL